MKFIIEIEVEPDKFIEYYLEANGIEPDQFEGSLEHIMEEELGWMQNSGIIRTEIVEWKMK